MNNQNELYWVKTKDEYIVEMVFSKDAMAAELVALYEDHVFLIANGFAKIQGVSGIEFMENIEPSHFWRDIQNHEIIDFDYNMSPFTEEFLSNEYTEVLEQGLEDKEHIRLESMK